MGKPGSTSSPATRVLPRCLYNSRMFRLLGLNLKTYMHAYAHIYIFQHIYMIRNDGHLLLYSQITYIIKQTQKWKFEKEKLNYIQKLC